MVARIRDDEVLVDAGLRTLGRIPFSELPAEIDGKPREALSVGDKVEALVLDSQYGRLPILSVAMLRERLAWSERSVKGSVRAQTSDPEAPGFQRRGERSVSKPIEYQLLDPVEFLQPNRRLFIDTNVFMATSASRAGGLKRLFERGHNTILANGNPIVVPTKVVDELTKQSRIDASGESAERAEAIKKAGAALTFLESASDVGLVRKDLGDDTNPYADDLFLKLFERFADTYEMCLLTHDITIKLRIRLLAHRLSKRLFVGVLTRSGDLEVDSDESLFQRGFRKYKRHATHIAEGNGTFKDQSEAAALKPLLHDFGKAFGLKEPTVNPAPRVPGSSSPKPQQSVAPTPINPFSPRTTLRPSDTPLTSSVIPTQGDPVTRVSADRSGSLVLGALLGEGGEG
ncbi:MAG TPA: hypothetical protein DEB57_14345, partial [Microbacterium sp.]|nr:hypothetical protein [Microbacterium sp.]